MRAYFTYARIYVGLAVLIVGMNFSCFGKQSLILYTGTWCSTGNTVHVTCMFHANFVNLHEQHNMHVIMSIYKHVSCNIQEFRTFSMHVTCMLSA